MPCSYRQLIAWQKARALAVEIYAISRGFPSSEQYGLVSQLRRAAVSVASHIAEGQGRLTTGISPVFGPRPGIGSRAANPTGNRARLALPRS
ncbi:MAG TPA: four helix bundle protein [Terriglobales bacterium]